MDPPARQLTAEDGVKQWLDNYAARHAHKGMRRGEWFFFLPEGDTSQRLYALYRQDMEKEGKKKRTIRKRPANVAIGSSADARAYAPASTLSAPVVDLEVFTKIWQNECEYLVLWDDACSTDAIRTTRGCVDAKPDAETYASASQGMASASSDAPVNVLKRPARSRAKVLRDEPVQYVSEAKSAIPPSTEGMESANANIPATMGIPCHPRIAGTRPLAQKSRAR